MHSAAVLPAHAGGGGVTHRAVALSGQPAPGLGDGITLLSPQQEFMFTNVPRIDDQGRVISHIFLAGPGIDFTNMRSVWSESGGPGNLALIAQQSQPAPGGNGTFVGFPSPLNPTTISIVNGQTTFVASMQSQAGVSFGVWSTATGKLTNLALSGAQAPGLPPGVVFGNPGGSNPFTGGFLNTQGHVLHGVKLVGPGVNDDNNESLWSNRSGSFQLVLREGDPAPGTNAVFGASPQSFSPGGLRLFTFNAQSNMALYGNLRGEGIDFLNDEGIWVEDAEDLHLIALEAAAAPGTNFTFGEQGTDDHFESISLNNDNKIAFKAGLSPDSGVSGNPTLWSNRTGALAMIVGPGINQPGLPAGSFTGVFLYTLTHENAIAFLAAFTGGTGIWSDHSGQMSLVIRTGDPAPQTSAGVTIDDLIEGDGRNFFKLATSGHIAFRATLEGPGVGAGNNRAYYLRDPDGTFHLIIRVGELFDVAGDGGDLRTVADVLPGGLNEVGQFVFKAGFTDGTLGIFVAEVAPRTAPGDVNGDGVVNVDDLIAVILSWGACPAPPAGCPADVNNSGSVDVDDLIVVILNWGG